MSSPAPLLAPDDFAGFDENAPMRNERHAPSRDGYLVIRNLQGSQWVLSDARRLVDISVAVIILVVFSIPMMVIAVLTRLTSVGPVLFAQSRVGCGGRMFSILKFRTMECTRGAHRGPGLTSANDCRVTPMGRVLRKLKLDELPQFFNILRGEMSLVGPRPKSPDYEALAEMPYRPGITGPATLAFRCEELILQSVPATEMEEFYQTRIRPLKARIDHQYMRRATLWSDMGILAATLLASASPATVPNSFRSRQSEVQVRPAEERAQATCKEVLESAG
jgi:lipopolysaccharide/colanic/teichoic acid biosynthesis glycosyltransferase